jgi:transcriptional regulator with XRE-family HTH domain
MNKPESMPRAEVDAVNVGKVLRKRRIAKKLSQEQLAKACGLSQNTLMKIENGQTVHSRFIWTLAVYLGISLEELNEIYGTIVPPDIATQSVAVETTNENDIAEIRQVNPTKARLIHAISYQVVDIVKGGSGRGLLISWTFKNGANVTGVLDATMLAETGAAALACYEELGIKIK